MPFRALLAVLAFTFMLGSAGCTQQPSGGPAAASSGGGGTSSDGTIKIGAFFSTTGNDATFGTSSMNGINMAVDEINAKGGVLGKKLVVVAEDDQSQADKASFAVQKLINQDHVDVVVGEVASTRSIAGGEIAQGAKVPMLSPSSTNPKVTENKDYVFRACFIDPFQGYVMGTFAYQNLNARTAAILTDKGSDYAIGLAKYFKDRFEKLGGKVLDEQFYQTDDTDFKGQLTTLKNLNPDVLFVPGYYTQVGLIARQARGLGYSKPILGGDGWDSPKLGEIGGKDLNNSYYSVHVDLHSDKPDVKTFVQNYKQRFNTEPDTLGTLAYDSIYLLADAYKRAGAVDKARLRDALASTKGFKGITGVITMTPERNPIKPAVVVKYVDGSNQYATTIYPEGMAPEAEGSAAPAASAASGAPNAAAGSGAPGAAAAPGAPLDSGAPNAGPASGQPAVSPAETSASPAVAPSAALASPAASGAPK
jgi:branched-chain amino acid transport system substrate-binding protein